MSRVEIASMPWGVFWDRGGNAQSGLDVTLKNLDGSAASHWSAVTGGSSATTVLTTDVDGTLPRYIEGGTYLLTAAGLGVTDQRVEAVPGDVASGGAGGVFSVTASVYGATGDGTTDDRAAVQAAVTAAAASITATGKGAVVYLPPGVYYFSSGGTPSGYAANSGVSIPVGLTAVLTIRGAGRGVTTIKLANAGARNAFYINKTADYDTFKNVTFEDFDVDNNNATGRCHVVIGNMPGVSTSQGRLSFADITVRRVNVYNVPDDITGATSAKSHVLFVGSHTSALEATQTTSTRIVVEDMRMQGGANGAVVASFGAGSLVGGTNHYYDQIFFRRLRHEIPTTPTTSGSQTSFYICGTGYGDYFETVDCHSTNIADDGWEIGSMQRGVIADCSSTDAFLDGILFRNTHALTSVTKQRIEVRNFTHRITSALAAISGATSRPVGWIGDNSLTFGTFVFDKLTCEADALVHTKHLQACIVLALDSTAVERREFDKCKIRVTNYVFDETSGTVDGSVVENASTSGTVVFRDLDIVVSVAANAGGGLNLYGVLHKGTTNRMDVDGYDFDGSGSVWSGGSGGGLWAYMVAKSTGNGIRSSLRRLRPIGNYGGTGVGNRPVGISTATTISSFRFSDSDLSSATNMSSDITYSAGVNDAKVHVLNVIGIAGIRLGPGGRRSVSATTDTILPHDGTIGITASGVTHNETLPAANAVPPGHIIRVKDEAGGAATNNITITRAGSDLIDGATTKVISTNYGSAAVYSNGSGWFSV